jgi:nicotinamidase-related amidase
MPRMRSRRALVLVDFINPLGFPHGRGFVERAVRAARRTRRLKRVLKSRGTPVVYANDHFGTWTRDFSELVRQCEAATAGRELARLLAPDPDDYPVLKPRHSAFYGTPLEFLLQELGVRALVITGIAADNCVLFTAHDAYLRRYELWIPRDCVASVRDDGRSRALLHMHRVLKADVRASRAAILATPNRANARARAPRVRSSPPRAV